MKSVFSLCVSAGGGGGGEYEPDSQLIRISILIF